MTRHLVTCWSVYYSKAAALSLSFSFFTCCRVRFKVTEEMASALYCVASSYSHVQKRCVHCLRAVSTRAAAPPTHLAASVLHGIKQTVIDLLYDCLFCLAASDGWRFARIWKVCVKYGWQWKGGAQVGVGWLFKNLLPQGDAAVGLWDDLSLYLHIVLN